MKSALQAFFLLLAGAPANQLVRSVEYLKAENEILRSMLPKRVMVMATERLRLVKLGKRVGSALKNLVTSACIRGRSTYLNTQATRTGRKPGASAA